MQSRFVKRCSSRNRLIGVLAAAVLCAGSLAGCSKEPANSPQPPGALPPVTAQMIVNGQAAGTTHTVSCTQDGWMHTIKTGDDKSGVTFVVDTGAKISAKSVVITNVGGFSGNFLENQIGKADASIIGNTFRVNGTAEGSPTADPNKHATANFDIKANC
jgi:ipoprotein LpqH